MKPFPLISLCWVKIIISAAILCTVHGHDDSTLITFTSVKSVLDNEEHTFAGSRIVDSTPIIPSAYSVATESRLNDRDSAIPSWILNSDDKVPVDMDPIREGSNASSFPVNLSRFMPLCPRSTVNRMETPHGDQRFEPSFPILDPLKTAKRGNLYRMIYTPHSPTRNGFEAKSIDYRNGGGKYAIYRGYLEIFASRTHTIALQTQSMLFPSSDAVWNVWLGYLGRYGLVILLFVSILTRLRSNPFEYHFRPMQTILMVVFVTMPTVHPRKVAVQTPPRFQFRTVDREGGSHTLEFNTNFEAEDAIQSWDLLGEPKPHVIVRYVKKTDPYDPEYRFGENYELESQDLKDKATITFNGQKYVVFRCRFYEYDGAPPKEQPEGDYILPGKVSERLQDAWKGGTVITIKTDDSSDAVVVPPLEDPPAPEFQPLEDLKTNPNIQIKYTDSWKVAAGHYEFETHDIVYQEADLIFLGDERYYVNPKSGETGPRAFFTFSDHKLLGLEEMNRRLKKAWLSHKIVKHLKYADKTTTVLAIPFIMDKRFPPQFKLFLTSMTTEPEKAKPKETTVTLQRGDTIYHEEVRDEVHEKVPILWPVDMRLTPDLLSHPLDRTHWMMQNVNGKLKRNWFNDEDSKFMAPGKGERRFRLMSQTPPRPEFTVLVSGKPKPGGFITSPLSMDFKFDSRTEETLKKKKKDYPKSFQATLRIKYITGYDTDRKYKFETTSFDKITIGDHTYTVQDYHQESPLKLLVIKKRGWKRPSDFRDLNRDLDGLSAALALREAWVYDRDVILNPEGDSPLKLMSWKELKTASRFPVNPPKIQIGIVYAEGPGPEDVKTYRFKDGDTFYIGDAEKFKFNVKEQSFNKKLKIDKVRNDLSAAWKEGKMITMGKFKWNCEAAASGAHEDMMNVYRGELYANSLEDVEHQADASHPDGYHGLNGFNSFPFDDRSHRNHYEALIGGEYNDVSGSGSALLIGGVVGASSVIIIVLIFCIGLAFGMIACWGYTQRKEEVYRYWKANDEEHNL